MTVSKTVLEGSSPSTPVIESGAILASGFFVVYSKIRLCYTGSDNIMGAYGRCLNERPGNSEKGRHNSCGMCVV